MPNYVLLNNIAHKNLRVVTEYSAKFGDDVMSAIAFPEEFRAIQAIYPIFFNKDSESGKFYPAALFGLRDGENLFLSDSGWDANYVPISVKRKPFLIGFQNTQVDGVAKRTMVVHVDINSPKISETEGEPIFLPHGGNSGYLKNIVDMLDYINLGNETNEGFIESLLENELLEAFSLDIELKDGSKNQLVGFYTINEEKLENLNAVQLSKLHAKGYLIFIYMVIASMSNVSHLVERIQARAEITA